MRSSSFRMTLPLIFKREETEWALGRLERVLTTL